MKTKENFDIKKTYCTIHVYTLLKKGIITKLQNIFIEKSLCTIYTLR